MRSRKQGLYLILFLILKPLEDYMAELFFVTEDLSLQKIRQRKADIVPECFCQKLGFQQGK